ncbi:MAG: [protein-PII] uridylyltransferase [Betaproteobacteria bacterium]|jgi:[protein-PII] uridylyltransferase|nr:[protein-PII] uridylyltransferase [Betaproteobacteria bacterium]
MSAVQPRRSIESAPISDSRERLREARAALGEAYLARPEAARYLHGHRRLVDNLLRTIWQQASFPPTFALVAVGGYGRGELFPHSDVDILILLSAPLSSDLRETVERFVGNLWDVGLEIGHSVRTVAECAEEAAKDITIRTTLFEARHLAGSRTSFRALEEAVRRDFDVRRYFKAKRIEQEQRHEKFQDTPYSLEPNLKESPGGLRDLQVILWVSRAARLAKDWRALAAQGLITTAEAHQLKRHEDLLRHIRIRLHLATARREDRILFDYQDALATQFGIQPTGSKRASEVFMQRYYRTAKAVTQLNTILLQNLGAAIFPSHGTEPEVINERFQSVRELLDARDTEVFEREPGAILESFLIMQQRSGLKGMTAPTLRALWRARAHIDASYRRDPANRARFVEILQQPRGIVHEFRRMNQYSILGRYLPPFGRIVGQMQHDLYHVYTVDQHILQVVRNLRRFTMVEHAHEYPLCSRLIADFDRHWLLYVAAIFHDIAKGRGGDHSKLGQIDARRFCVAHDLAPEDTDLVAFLVEHHLTMSTFAQKRDLADPDVVAEFARIVRTERRLIALYLLTVADIRGTSPKVWNAWKGKLLEDLLRAARAVLRGDAAGFDQDVQAKQAEAKRLLRLYALSDNASKELWRQLDLAYFLRHDPQEIAWQTRHLHYRAAPEKPVVKARLSPIGEGIQVMIYCRDQPDLFARICGYFGQIGDNILDAKIHTTRHGYALDTFLVLSPPGSSPYREMSSLIEHDLAERLERHAPLPPPVNGRVSRQLKHFPVTPEVHIQPDERGPYHVLSITAGDRPGLLYAIARVLGKYHISLHTAKIVTLGERAEDVFVVTGAALEKERTMLRLENELLAALQ